MASSGERIRPSARTGVPALATSSEEESRSRGPRCGAAGSVYPASVVPRQSAPASRLAWRPRPTRSPAMTRAPGVDGVEAVAEAAAVGPGPDGAVQGDDLRTGLGNGEAVAKVGVMKTPSLPTLTRPMSGTDTAARMDPEVLQTLGADADRAAQDRRLRDGRHDARGRASVLPGRPGRRRRGRLEGARMSVVTSCPFVVARSGPRRAARATHRRWETISGMSARLGIRLWVNSLAQRPSHRGPALGHPPAMTTTSGSNALARPAAAVPSADAPRSMAWAARAIGRLG